MITREAKIGLIVTLCIASLIWGVNFLKGRNLFSSTNTYYAVFSNVDGLLPTNEVLLSGYKVGQVRGIQFEEGHTGRLIVTLIIGKQYKIPENSVAKLISANIMGGKAISLDLAPNNTFHAHGDTLFSSVELGLMNQLSSQISPIAQRVDALVAELTSTLGAIAQVLNQENRDNLSNSLGSLESTLSNLSVSAVSINQMLDSETGALAQTISNANAITYNLRANNTEITNIIQNFSSVSDSIAKSNLAATIHKTDSVLSSLSLMLARVNTGEGSLGKMFTNDSLYINLEQASKNLDMLLEDIRANPHRYINVSLIGGRKN